MVRNELEQMLNKDNRMLVKRVLNEHDELVEYLYFLSPCTGIVGKFFCNNFMMESVELLKHSIFLYEEGFFDCAFYSVRQSIENMNNMLLFSQNHEEFIKWKAKKFFPPDRQIKSRLQQVDMAYSEIKTIIPEVFNVYDDLLKKANKYIHKQGFDAFYVMSCQMEKIVEDRTKLFVDFLKQAIGLLMIMNIILDPLSLALSDPKVDAHVSFDPITACVPIEIFEGIFSVEIIEKIKNTRFYREFVSCILEKEEMNDAVYTIIRYQHYDVNLLSDIQKQLSILDIRQVLCFEILNAQIRVSHFYFEDDFLGYSTSIKPLYECTEYRSDQFEQYTVGDGKKNISWKGMFVSVYRVYETYIILQHNEPFSEADLSKLQAVIDKKSTEYSPLGTDDFRAQGERRKAQGERVNAALMNRRKRLVKG